MQSSDEVNANQRAHLKQNSKPTWNFKERCEPCRVVKLIIYKKIKYLFGYSELSVFLNKKQ